MAIFTWLLFGVIFGYAATIAAGLRNRNTLLWYWCGFLGTIFGFLVIMALPAKEDA